MYSIRYTIRIQDVSLPELMITVCLVITQQWQTVCEVCEHADE